MHLALQYNKYQVNYKLSTYLHHKDKTVLRLQDRLGTRFFDYYFVLY